MITVAEAKQHLRVMHALEDGLIQLYLDAALGHVAEYLGDDMPDPLPEPIQAAVLLLTGDLYINRERQTDRILYESTAYTLLLAPYRTMAVL
ncbi:head-tail connector protein [Stutzerimonas stutzeri]|uniref:head-tail connector protein n=1 Tax=Stutzerimonas stutzeri TaxID=316 RepID=UPI00031E38FD|nr:head-tail connector protein [Stutzerimonas stutzeri]